MKANTRKLASPCSTLKTQVSDFPRLESNSDFTTLHTTDELLNNPCFSYQTIQDLKSHCQNFLIQSKLNIFEFARIYNDGTAIILYSDQQVAQYIVKNRIHVTAHVPTNLVAYDFWYVPSISGQYFSLIKDIKGMTGSGGFADYIQRFNGYYDMFCFWSPKDQDDANNQFLNLKSKLESYCKEFKNRAHELIEKSSHHRFALPKEMVPNIGGLKPNETKLHNIDLKSSFARIHSELEKLSQVSTLGDYIIPTRREIDCIWHLVNGKTIPEIAAELHLSPRTVENYFNSLKDKLGCQKKSEIISTLLKLYSKS